MPERAVSWTTCGPSRLPRTAIVSLVKCDERVPGFCSRVTLELNEVLHFQAASTQQADHVAVAEVKLHRLIIWPFEPVHTEVRPQQPLGSQLIQDSAG
jgi:hypothetical protein